MHSCFFFHSFGIKDEDDDYIRVTSDLELLHAMQVMATPSVVKFFAIPEDEVRSVVHEDVSCDSCGMEPIIGHRYECVQCENYDLCRTCENRGVHGKHNMRRHATGRGFFLTGKAQRPQPRAAPAPAEPSWRSQPPTPINDTKKTDLLDGKQEKRDKLDMNFLYNVGRKSSEEFPKTEKKPLTTQIN